MMHGPTNIKFVYRAIVSILLRCGVMFSCRKLLALYLGYQIPARNLFFFNFAPVAKVVYHLPVELPARCCYQTILRCGEESGLKTFYV